MNNSNTKVNPQLSLSWYIKVITDFTSHSKDIKNNNIGRIETFPKIGKLYSFWYDPKLKEKLPYYDSFPLTFMIGKYPDGYLGINLHYLPPDLRSGLFNQLLKITNTPTMNEKSRLVVSYDILNSAARFKAFEPCIKRYLHNHIQSPFLEISPVYWEKVIGLPLQRFDKKSTASVWKDSRSKIR